MREETMNPRQPNRHHPLVLQRYTSRVESLSPNMEQRLQPVHFPNSVDRRPNPLKARRLLAQVCQFAAGLFAISSAAHGVLPIIDRLSK
jgi:hypothetical protein